MDIRLIFLSFLKFLHRDGVRTTIGVLDITVAQARQLDLEVVEITSKKSFCRLSLREPY